MTDLKTFRVCLQLEDGGAVVTVQSANNDDDLIFDLAVDELLRQVHGAKLGYIEPEN